MQVVTPHFGTLDIDENSLINFPDGLPGFESCIRFKLLHEDVPEPKVMWMQSLDDAEVVFSVMDAQLLGFHYQLNLSDAECERIAFTEGNELVLLLTLSREGEAEDVKANTQSPIVLNTVSRLALQKTGVRTEIIFTNS